MKASLRFFVLLGALSVGMLVVGSAYACNPGGADNGHYYLDGWLTGEFAGEPNCIIGSQADLLVKDPYVSPGGHSGAWTMLQWYGTTNSFAQVGYGKQTTGADPDTDDNFFEYDTPGLGDHIHWDVGNVLNPVVGNYLNYKVAWSGGVFHFWIGGTLVYTTDSTSYGGCAADQMGEIYSAASQMPGISTGHEVMQNASVWEPPSGWIESSFWESYDYDVTNQPPTDASADFGNSPDLPAASIDTWDKRCT